MVGGGVSVLHCTVGGEHDLMSAFRAFLNTIVNMFPSGLQWSFPPAGQVLTQENGEVADTWVDSSPVSPLTGGSVATFTNGVGIRVKWVTAAIHDGEHVVGSTFLVPITVLNYEGAGNISDASISAVQAAATTFVAAAGLRIYARPKPGVDGASYAVNGAVVPDKVTWLRGRRT